MQTVPYKAPDFSLKSSDGVMHSLSDYAGKWLVMYFYPMDDTPGCTIEACSMRDARDQLTDLGAEVIGVSRDNGESHDKFTTKYNLNFTLLSDPDMTAMKAYGAWGKKTFGHEGVLRRTYIINPAGQVVKVYGRVTPFGHGDQIVGALQQLMRES